MQSQTSGRPPAALLSFLKKLFNTAAQNSVGKPDTTLVSYLLRVHTAPCTGRGAETHRGARFESPARQIIAGTRIGAITRAGTIADPGGESSG